MAQGVVTEKQMEQVKTERTELLTAAGDTSHL
jgi:hypothetical protein